MTAERGRITEAVSAAAIVTAAVALIVAMAGSCAGRDDDGADDCDHIGLTAVAVTKSSRPTSRPARPERAGTPAPGPAASTTPSRRHGVHLHDDDLCD